MNNNENFTHKYYARILISKNHADVYSGSESIRQNKSNVFVIQGTYQSRENPFSIIVMTINFRQTQRKCVILLQQPTKTDQTTL